MATYCSEDGGDGEIFSCPICFEDYDLQDARRSPKLLLCLHTFCYECTQKLWKNDGSLECSMCRMLHEEVTLDDLFDNPIIIQHLQKEREEQDLKLARKIDQELRNEFGGSPVMVVPENSLILVEQNNTIDILDSSSDNNETDETDLTAPEVDIPRDDMDDDDQEEDIHNQSDCQNNLFAELLESLRMSPQMGSDSGREDGDDDDNDEVDDLEIEDVELDSSSDTSNGDDSMPFSFDRIRELLRDDDNEEEDEEEEVEEESENEGDPSVEINENPILRMESMPCFFSFAENDDEDEDDERFHSACDDINTAIRGGEEELPMHDRSEDDTDTNTCCWQIASRETLLED